MGAYKINEYLRPIGSIYMTVNDINPAVSFGGNWVKISEKFLYCADSTKEEKGENTHQLTVEEMPKHTHDVNYANGTNWVNGQNSWSYRSKNEWTFDRDFTSTGGNKSHNNMPAYITVHIWYRVS